jgi:hypothetical protein
VAIGLVQSLSRPGGNVTPVPGASNIALLVNPGNPIHKLMLANEVPDTARGVSAPSQREVPLEATGLSQSPLGLAGLVGHAQFCRTARTDIE